MNNSMVEPDLDAIESNGERMVPERSDPNTFWEHVYRYRFAARRLRGKRVLDIACGEGYGTAAIHRAGAASVVGVDVAYEACRHGRDRYQIATVNGSAESIGFADGSFDAVVSFETIEHLRNPASFVRECRRVLAPGGQLVISTPNLDVFSQVATHNPHHHSEMSEADFTKMLLANFAKVEMFGQHPLRAPWWSWRSFAAQRTPWARVRGFQRGKAIARHLSGIEASDAGIEVARQNPVRWIAESSEPSIPLLSPFEPYRRWRGSGEWPLFLVAVAQVN